eukprot:CAMPEP_0203690934 /NCGR_PEP_ID=MMETSP0091-20130426/3276_1 /ASSEMBLY_ACC=CAM_ASM_001089 /TAXON_ID=426623 /ORGANISM="Chaetoceros affinis, Strain CCMP159" /LENGTH=340 /DNA_ID=CAMNT_0050561259 /DNA_START=91 /DNA_END=1113 /DNA_ORIENTATION=+
MTVFRVNKSSRSSSSMMKPRRTASAEISPSYFKKASPTPSFFRSTSMPPSFSSPYATKEPSFKSAAIMRRTKQTIFVCLLLTFIIVMAIPSYSSGDLPPSKAVHNSRLNQQMENGGGHEGDEDLDGDGDAKDLNELYSIAEELKDAANEKSEKSGGTSIMDVFSALFSTTESTSTTNDEDTDDDTSGQVDDEYSDEEGDDDLGGDDDNDDDSEYRSYVAEVTEEIVIEEDDDKNIVEVVSNIYNIDGQEKNAKARDFDFNGNDDFSLTLNILSKNEVGGIDTVNESEKEVGDDYTKQEGVTDGEGDDVEEEEEEEEDFDDDHNSAQTISAAISRRKYLRR